MDDDEFAELYGSSAVEEPVVQHKPAAANGAPSPCCIHLSHSIHSNAAAAHTCVCWLLTGGLVTHQSLQPVPAAAAAARNDDYDDLYGQVRRMLRGTLRGMHVCLSADTLATLKV
jgi:hypothetical protein